MFIDPLQDKRFALRQECHVYSLRLVTSVPSLLSFVMFYKTSRSIEQKRATSWRIPSHKSIFKQSLQLADAFP